MMKTETKQRYFYDGLVLALAAQGNTCFDGHLYANHNALAGVAVSFNRLQRGKNNIRSFPSAMLRDLNSGNFLPFQTALQNVASRFSGTAHACTQIVTLNTDIAAARLMSDYTFHEQTVLRELAGKYKAPAL